MPSLSVGRAEELVNKRHVMAKKTRVSLTRGMMAAVVTKGFTDPWTQYLVDPMFAPVTPTMTVKHAATTASHKIAKNATIHGSLSNTARVRKKKRRDVDVTERKKRMPKLWSSWAHLLIGATEGRIRALIIRYRKLLAHLGTP